MLYSVVIPCYKSCDIIEKVVKLTRESLEDIGKTPYEFVLVNDCSPDGGKTRAKLKELAGEFPFVRVVDLAKNTGQHNAIMAGLNYANGDFIIGMDDDLQTHPSQLPKLFDEMDNGGYDVVYGYYLEKKHSIFRNLGSKINALTVKLLIGGPKGLITSSFWIMKKYIRDSIITYVHPYTYLRGLILRSTSNIQCIPVKHFERESGKSGYTFKSLVKLWTNILGFSIVPLKIATYLGYAFSAVGLLGAIFVIAQKLSNPNMQIGWPSIIVTICFFSGLILTFLGLIGEYIGRLFMGHNSEPQYVVREVIN